MNAYSIADSFLVAPPRCRTVWRISPPLLALLVASLTPPVFAQSEDEKASAPAAEAPPPQQAPAPAGSAVSAEDEATKVAPDETEVDEADETEVDEAGASQNEASQTQAAPGPVSQTDRAPQAEPQGSAKEEKEMGTERDDVDDDEDGDDEDEDEPETYDGPATLLGGRDDDIAVGGYGGVTVLGTSIDKQGAVLVGGEAALLLDHRFALGVGGMGLANEIGGAPFPNGDPSALGFGYGGGILRYHLLSERSPVALSLGVLVGGGGLAVLRKVGVHEYEYQDDPEDVDVFFVAEPSIQGHLYLTRWMRVGLNGSYRFVHLTSRNGYSAADLGGFAGGAHIQFGWF